MVIAMIAATPSATLLPLARHVVSRVQDRDVLALDFQCGRQGLVGPANVEVVLVDASDDAEPPAVRLAIALPVFPDDVRADLERIPGIGRADRVRFARR